MEYEKLKQLIDDIGNSKLTSLEIEFPDGTKINANKENKEVITTQVPVEVISNKTVEAKTETETNVDKQKTGNIVKSPMVGTFYIKPSPDAKPYVEIGKHVKKGDVLCIIEAMKLMNEIESEYDGEIVEIYVKDGEPVEYGKPLFRIK